MKRIKTVMTEERSEHEAWIDALNLALENKAEMTLDEFLHTVFGFEQITKVQIYKILPPSPGGGFRGGQASWVGDILNTPANQQRENYQDGLVSMYGVGEYELVSIAGGRKRSGYRITLGEPQGEGYHAARGFQDEANLDREMERVIKRKSALVLAKELDQMARGEEEDVKGVAEIIKAVQASRAEGADSSAGLITFLSEQNKILLQGILEKNKGQESTGVNIFSQFLEKLGPKDLMRVIDKGPAELVKSWTMQDVLVLLQAVPGVLQAVGREVVGPIVQAVQGRPSSAVVTLSPAPPESQPKEGESMRSDLIPPHVRAAYQEAVGKLLAWIRDKNYPAAWTLMQFSFGDVAGLITADTDPQAVLPWFKTLDPQAAELAGEILNFILWIRGERMKEEGDES